MSAPSLMRNKILVLGRRGDISKDFEDHAGKRVPWKIATKYYTAQVEFWIDETVQKDLADAEVIKGYENEESGIGNVVDAILFVFRKDQPSTFDDIHVYLPFIRIYEPSIILAIGTGKIDANKSHEDEDAFENWCLENGFEYVDAEEEEQENGERVGLNRILEALQSNMWEGMVREPLNDNDSHLEEHENYQELSITQLKLDQKNAKNDMMSPLHDYNSAPFDNDDVEFFKDVLPSQKEIESMYNHIFDDFDDEDGLDKVLTRLNSLRERGKTLSDKERRKLAASVACSFGLHVGEK
ncbi:15980_t:CDS:2 [Cetraspora pellucida]|uniref:15980_t:CDS:1 n=1 Tax=Cetraspora pellucida TaxID=1433469 RepID=A0A9N9GA42_9GLOM|nr:15980_t:CDS:2 [Cetraspora pellucida]